MPFVIGIDEAGYGPLLGPLVSAATVWHVSPEHVNNDLWVPLADCVAKTGKRGDWRFTIGDSKKVFKRDKGVGGLERAVLAFMNTTGGIPQTLDDLLGILGSPIVRESLPWYADLSLPMPTDRKQAASADLVGRLQRTMTQNHVSCRSLMAEVVTETVYNARVAQTRNKASVLLERVLKLLQRSLEWADAEDTYIHVDRLGGRSHYRDILMDSFPDRQMQILEESADRSAYRMEGDKNCWEIEFVVKADKNHLPVALASMTAKYVRELLMERFNTYWHAVAPDIAPTAGYYTDAKRFLGEIEPILADTGLAREQFVRSR